LFQIKICITVHICFKLSDSEQIRHLKAIDSLKDVTVCFG
jgi:hypothetical protein